MDYETLTYDLRDHVAHITLNRPEAANAINLQLAIDLMQVSLATSSDPSVRAILLTGTGRFFCAGGDLKSFAAQGDGLPGHMKEVTTFLHGAISRFTRGDAPLIAAINGVAAGAGMSLACSCDIVLAAESARFTMAYTKAGLTPDGSSTYFLPRKVGLRRALELTLLNPMVDAAQAQEYGLVTRVVPDDRLMAEATAAAEEVAAGPTIALGEARRLFHSGLVETLETQMELETQAIARMTTTADGREGVQAFLEKRAPTFSGR
ncbi:MAG: enoyl-CoA hydratase [Chloroflexi bacterium]|nr:enoyl-CoA hydratase [Chloroflexota bacterium]